MNKLKKIKDIFQYLLIILVFISPLLFYINTSYYTDIFRLSMIKIDSDIIRGEKKSIKKAIKKIKKEDPRSYRILHRYVDRIAERHCIVADHVTHKDEYLEGLNLPGCYVRGTKTIYLIPEKKHSNELIEKRAQTISKLSKLSMEYWNDQK